MGLKTQAKAQRRSFSAHYELVSLDKDIKRDRGSLDQVKLVITLLLISGKVASLSLCWHRFNFPPQQNFGNLHNFSSFRDCRIRLKNLFEFMIWKIRSLRRWPELACQEELIHEINAIFSHANFKFRNFDRIFQNRVLPWEPNLLNVFASFEAYPFGSCVIAGQLKKGFFPLSEQF